MKIYITGRSGFIGSLLANRLSEEGHEIVDPGNLDLRDYKNIGNDLIEKNPDIIIHLAARTEVEKSFYEQVPFSEINYVGTVNLVEAARQVKNLKLFIFSSTMETFGWQLVSDMAKARRLTEDEVKKYTFNEETRQHPNAPYAVAKFACEQYLQYASRAYNLPYCILRQTNAYGRPDNDFFVVEQFITQMLKSKEVNFGYKEPYRNFIYIDDLLNLYSEIISNINVSKKKIFCTGPANAIRISDLAEKIASKIGWQGKINWNTRPKRRGEIYYLNSTNKYVTSVLGWEPKTTLDEGLNRTIKLWKAKLLN